MNSPSTSQRGAQMMNRRLAKRLKDQPAGAVADSQPSYIDVTSNLAEDTVIADTFDIAPGDFTVAMFANPLTGSEEMLYIDEQDTLRWARHVNADGGVAPGGLSGWSTEAVALDTRQVVVVVHPAGSVCAFTLATDPTEFVVNLYTLVLDDSVPGGLRWDLADTTWLAGATLAGLSTFLPVQYTDDRPATPVVFIDSPDGFLFWAMPTYPDPGATWQSPWLLDSCQYDEADKLAVKVAGVESTNLEFSQRPVVKMVTLWTQLEEALYVSNLYPRTGELTRELVSLDTKRLIGPFTSPNHAGVLYEAILYPNEVQRLTTTCQLETGTGYTTTIITLDKALTDLRAWQDAGGLLHIYGRDADATLKVIHQTGWQTDAGALPGGAFEPVFETTATPHYVYPAIARPLIADVARYAVDPYPDDMPDQHVIHQGARSGEGNALYSQSTRTSFWHEERMRLVPQDLPKPYVVPRYETTMTVRNSYGGAVGGCEVRLTADSPVDLEVEGRFYRTDTDTPVTLQADARGQVTLRVVARGLNVPHLIVTVPGMSQALTVQMAGDVHRFLAGTDNLPNHQDGFTPEVVQSATVPGETTRLFPDLAPADALDESWPPSAKDLVTWCQGAFAVEAGTPLPPAMFEGLGEEEEVCGFSISARDPSRPGFEVFTSAEQLAAHRQALRDQGVVDELSSWFGDVWQAIGDGVIDVARATINLLDQTVELVIAFADEVEALFVCAWDDIVSAAHAVEAAFVAVGAEIEKVIDWLKWVFSFTDALKTAKQLYALVDSAPDMIKDVVTSLGTVADDFFISKEEEVRALFEGLKEKFGNASIASLQGPTGSVPAGGQPDPQVSSATDQLQGPHASWFTDKVCSTAPNVLKTTSPGSSGGPGTGVADPGDLINDFIAAFAGSTDLPELPKALDDLGQLFWNLFSGKSADSVLATEVVTLLDLAETLIILILKILDNVVNGALEWAKAAVDAVKSVFETEVDEWADVPLLSTLWDFVVEESGLDADDYPFTLGMVGAFFVGYPFTVIWKIVAEDQPFPDGIPVPPKAGSAKIGDAELSDALLAFQAFQGAVQTVDAALDLVLNTYVLSGDEDWKPSEVLLAVFAVGHFFAYVIGDHPWFWGYPPPAPQSHRNLPYIRYGPTFVLNMIDLLLALKFGTIAEMFEPEDDDPDKEKKEGIFATFCFLCGWERIAINIVEYNYLSDPSTGDDFDPAAPNWFDMWNLWINITAYIQTATGFVRYLAQHPSEYEVVEEFIYVALGIKNVVDVAGDVFSGVCTVIQPGRERYQRAAIQNKPKEGAFDFGTARINEPFVSTLQVQVAGGWPMYSWTALQTGGDGTDWLPPGLRLERLENSAGWVGDAVRISGIPVNAPEGAWPFTLAMEDNYGPSAKDSAPAVLNLDPARGGVPEVTFTCSVLSGTYPLQVTFTNTTTDAYTDLRWDFGDGQTWSFSDPANPTITYQWSGTFTAVLACENEYGWGAASRTITVYGPPAAHFTATPSTGAAPLRVQLTDTSSGPPTRWSWDFGDGRTSTEQNPTVTYEVPGEYVITLLVNNPAGGSGTDQVVVVS